MYDCRINGFPEIKEKITECIYEVTDTFCMFLCNRKPDHKTEHFFAPDISECTVPPIPSIHIRSRLQQVS